MLVHAVIQARMGSSRLAGKVLRPLGGTPVLSWVVGAARATPDVDGVIVATSSESGDDVIAALAGQMGVPVVRGDEHDVLGRFATALSEHPCDAVVRLTADCPLLDPALVGQVVAAWRRDPSLEYVSTTLIRTLPRGLDVELISSSALRRLDASATDYHRSHVTSGAYTDPGLFRMLGLVVQPDASDLRVTLDTPEDAALLDGLVSILGLGPHPWRLVVETLREHPELIALNALVQQKRPELG